MVAVGDHYTLLHTKYIGCGPHGFRYEYFRELVALLNMSSWCLVMVERLFLAVPRGCQRFVILVFPDHTHLLFLN